MGFCISTGKANLIKSTMTQAILYGSHPEVSFAIVLIGLIHWLNERRTPCISASRLTLMKKR